MAKQALTEAQSKVTGAKNPQERVAAKTQLAAAEEQARAAAEARAKAEQAYEAAARQADEVAALGKGVIEARDAFGRADQAATNAWGGQRAAAVEAAREAANGSANSQRLCRRSAAGHGRYGDQSARQCARRNRFRTRSYPKRASILRVLIKR